MEQLKSILIVQPGISKVKGMPGLVTAVRRETPEYTLALLSAICGLVVPDCQRHIISLRKPVGDEIRSLREIVQYGQHELELEIVNSFPKNFKLQVQSADVALISATFTCEAYAVVHAIRELKSINPALTTVIGGTDAQFRPEFYLGKGADIVLIGSAEASLPTLLRALDMQSDLSKVPNLFWKEDTSTIHQSDKINVEDMSPLSIEASFAHALVDDSAFYGTSLHEGPPPRGVNGRSAYLRTSIGCRPGNCGFCTTPVKSDRAGNYCALPGPKLNYLLSRIAEKDIQTVQIIDDNFLAREDTPEGEKDLFAALEAMRRLGFAWEWANGLQLSRLLRNGRPRQDLIDALFSPQSDECGHITGGYRAFVPFETALRRRPVGYCNWSKMKGFGLEEAIAIIESLDKTGVPMLSLGVMIGFPHDTIRDIEETVEGMKVVERTTRSLNRTRKAQGLLPMETHWDVVVYMLLPGTRDFKSNRHRLLFNDDYYTAPELLNFQTVAYWPDNFTPWELTKIRAEIAAEFGSVDVQNETGASTCHTYKALG